MWIYIQHYTYITLIYVNITKFIKGHEGDTAACTVMRWPHHTEYIIPTVKHGAGGIVLCGSFRKVDLTHKISMKYVEQ